MSQKQCLKHSIPLSSVCGELVCGLCYEELILREKKEAKDQNFSIESVAREMGHNDKFMRKKKVTMVP